jgi:hypothetical protein
MERGDGFVDASVERPVEALSTFLEVLHLDTTQEVRTVWVGLK